MQSIHRAARPAKAILAAALAFASMPALAQTFTNTVFFGDSLTDSGFYRPFFASAVGPQTALAGKFTTNPGYVWSELFAQHYGYDGSPGWQLGGTGAYVDAAGNNYAAGGARVTQQPGVPPQLPTSLAPTIQMQVSRYLSENGQHVDPGALYAFWAGGNDAFVFQSAVGAGASVSTELPKLLLAAGQEGAIIKDFVGRGARYVMVMALPNGALTPSTIATAQAIAAAFGPAAGQAVLQQAADVTAAYNTTLFGSLAGTRVIPVNTYAFLGEVVGNYSFYGLANATSGACNTALAPIPLCSPATFVAPGVADSYLWADGSGHLTSAGHRLIADYAISMIDGPRQIAVLPVSEAMVGRARAERVAAHLGSKPEADGMRWWGDVRGDSQRYHEPNHFDGFGPTVTFGVDWTAGSLVYGAFAGYGVQKIDFGLRGGDFKQTDATLGGAIGWYGDALWVNGQASYSKLSYDVDRNVRLGPATRTHSGSPDGDNLSLGFSAGWNMEHGKLTHGPVLSVLAQKIQVDAYDEDSTASTALSYPEQDFDSLIASVGWQSSYAINDHVHPYARATFDREFEDAPAEVFAQSRSMPGTLPYAVPGLERDERFGTLLLGVRTTVMGLDANVGVSATVNQAGGNDASMFATFGGRF
jgi:outer membrane lipase/esterase